MQRKQQPNSGKSAKPTPSRPRTKEDAIRELMEKDPQKAAQILREILKGR